MCNTERKDSHGPYDIPQPIHEGLVAYKFDGSPTGSFLQMVIENDLLGAMGRADPESEAALRDICRWVYWELPISAMGKEGYKKWIDSGGTVGIASARAAIAKAEPTKET